MKKVDPSLGEIGHGKVLYYAPLDGQHHRIVGGVAICQVAVCQSEEGYFLLGCDADGEHVTDTWHETLEDALDQAELQFKGISTTWQRRE